MRKLIPLLLASAGLIAIVGVLFLLIRTDALPARVRSFEWRKAAATPPAAPVEVEAETV
jgi:hypothetical protein